VTARPARPDDVDDIFDMVCELADYERARHEVESSPDDLSTALFGPDPAVHCHVVDEGESAAGFALWYVTYSTWTGRHGIWLEDLFVRPASRGRGHGQALLAALAEECVRQGYRRLEWAVLDWNHPAREFYASLGATSMDEWTVNRLAGSALDVLGRAGSAGGRGRG
jgi:GNAT superfamily N-acetyltransferase